ncbi:hypothetical protein LF817_18330 [Halobacillus sp. A1]|uniref:hypothetical protein n=1 Tax=Halobacillus sp. A1 TaxID=2880262 RepID=UPI0020A64132|nr:hypothetical protein [Halobacillus sp. A1]MCP3033287.1 hypothetical protein [Halobacillus sp. A1]
MGETPSFECGSALVSGVLDWTGLLKIKETRGTKKYDVSLSKKSGGSPLGYYLLS